MSFQAFKILNNLKPTTLHQANWVSAAIEHFLRAHPELLPKINAFYKETAKREDGREWLLIRVGGRTK